MHQAAAALLSKHHLGKGELKNLHIYIYIYSGSIVGPEPLHLKQKQNLRHLLYVLKNGHTCLT